MAPGRLATGVVLLVVAVGVLVGCSGGGEPDALANFEETLPDMTEDFGEDARVLSVVVKPDTTTYEVLTNDGKVLTRLYDVKTTTHTIPGGPNRGPSRTKSQGRYETEGEREASKDELKRPTVTLGQLEPGVVDRMLAESGGNFTTTSTLTGRTWVLAPPGIGSGYEANFDGTGLHAR